MNLSSTPRTLYLKAGPDGTSIGDCPFAHYVQMVLYEKQVSFTAQPTTQETKPQWLIQKYGGSMPALQCGNEEVCLIESEAIAQFVEESVKSGPNLKCGNCSVQEMEEAKECTNGFFPAVARYLKCTEYGTEQDLNRTAALEQALQKIESHLGNEKRTGPFLAGNGDDITLLDCSLIPKLYHLSVGIQAFKQGKGDSSISGVNLERQFPLVFGYMTTLFKRDSFQKSRYPEETIIWGWSNARASS